MPGPLILTIASAAIMPASAFMLRTGWRRQVAATPPVRLEKMPEKERVLWDAKIENALAWTLAGIAAAVIGWVCASYAICGSLACDTEDGGGCIAGWMSGIGGGLIGLVLCTTFYHVPDRRHTP